MGDDAKEFKVRKAPQQARSRATVEAIFQAALQVLEKAESPDASVADIAERAGVSVGSLYQYFPRKEALVNALLSRHLEDRMAVLAQTFAAAEGKPAEEAAKELVHEFVASMKARHRLERALVRAFVRVGSVAALTQYDEVMLTALERFLKSLGEQIRVADPAIAAFIICNALRSTVLLAMVQTPERLDDPRFAQELTHLVVSYLRR